jgi:hypothetical protein
LRARETCVLRGLNRLEPLPCAKTTIPFAAFGTASKPASLLGNSISRAVEKFTMGTWLHAPNWIGLMPIAV